MPSFEEILISIILTIACWLLWLYRRNKAIVPKQNIPRTNITSRRKWRRNEYPVRGPAPVPGRLPMWAAKAVNSSPATCYRSPLSISEDMLALVPVRPTTICPRGNIFASAIADTLNRTFTTEDTEDQEPSSPPDSPVQTLGGSYCEIAPGGEPYNPKTGPRRRRRAFTRKLKPKVRGTRSSAMRQERGRSVRLGDSVRRKLSVEFSELD